MVPLNLTPRGGRLEILCIGAHCDDIEIGCGGTVLGLQRRYPDCRIHWMVLTSTPARREEAIASFHAFVADTARGELRIGDLPDGLLPADFTSVKRQFEVMKEVLGVDFILTHQAEDRHQDHAVVSQVTWQTFRNHLIWEYEIPKYEGDLGRPNVYVPLPRALAERKTEQIVQAYESQRGKSWFNAENLLAVMRLRGLECRSESGFAEAFCGRKIVMDVGSG